MMGSPVRVRASASSGKPVRPEDGAENAPLTTLDACCANWRGPTSAFIFALEPSGSRSRVARCRSGRHRVGTKLRALYPAPFDALLSCVGGLPRAELPL